MKRQIQLWGSRIIMLALVIVATQRWGYPLYKQYFSPKKEVVFVPTAKVKMGSFTVSFHEIGTLAAEKSVPVYGEDNGKIMWIVSEGTIVKAGDKIAEMDRSELEREMRNQELTLKNAESDVERAKSELAILIKSNETEYKKQELDYDFNVNECMQAEETLKKKKRLALEKLVPTDQVEQAQLQVDAKKLAVKKGDMDLQLKKKDIDSKQRQKEADVLKVEFARDTQKRNLDELKSRVTSGVVVAPAPGMAVISKTWAGPGDYRKLQEGDTLHRRQTICQLPDLSQMLVRVNVGESDAPRIKIGMAVLVRLEAIPDKVLHGTVTEISSLATEGNPWETGSTPGRKNFEVTVALKESDPKSIKPGMTANAEFICDALKNVLSVPLESVVEKDGKTFVFVKTPKGWQRTKIVTGKYNDNFIVVTKGLKKGQVVALRDPTRPMEQQEAGASGPGAEKKKEKEKPGAMPMPDAGAAKK